MTIRSWHTFTHTPSTLLLLLDLRHRRHSALISLATRQLTLFASAGWRLGCALETDVRGGGAGRGHQGQSNHPGRLAAHVHAEARAAERLVTRDAPVRLSDTNPRVPTSVLLVASCSGRVLLVFVILSISLESPPFPLERRVACALMRLPTQRAHKCPSRRTISSSIHTPRNRRWSSRESDIGVCTD